MKGVDVCEFKSYVYKELPAVVRLSRPVVVTNPEKCSQLEFKEAENDFVLEPTSSTYTMPHLSRVIGQESLSFQSNMRSSAFSRTSTSISLSCNAHLVNASIPLMKPTLPSNKIRFCPTEEWIPEMHVVNCMSPDCGASFNLFTRKYHCRMCGRVFCATCCSNEIVVENMCYNLEAKDNSHQTTNNTESNSFPIRSNTYTEERKNSHNLCENAKCENATTRTFSFTSNTPKLTLSSQKVLSTNSNKELEKLHSSLEKEKKEYSELCTIQSNKNEITLKRKELKEHFSTYCQPEHIDNHHLNQHRLCENDVEKEIKVNQAENSLHNINKEVYNDSGQHYTSRENTYAPIVHEKLFTKHATVHSDFKEPCVSNNVINVPSLTDSSHQVSEVPLSSLRLSRRNEEISAQKNYNNASADLANVTNSSSQMESNAMLSTVYVCRSCYYETQLVISRRQEDGQLRRKSRGEFKMFQRALIVNILSFLTLMDLAEVALVSSDFYFMAKDNVIWYQYNVRRWTLDTEQQLERQQANLSSAARSLNYLNPFPSQSMQDLRWRLSNAPSSPLLLSSSSAGVVIPSSSSVTSTASSSSLLAPSFSQLWRNSAQSMSTSNLEDVLMEDATALTANEAARRVISLHSRYSFTQFLDFTRRQEMARCGGMAAFTVGYRILFSNPIKIAFLGPRHIGKTTCIRAFFDEVAIANTKTTGTMGFTRFVRSIRLVGGSIAEVPVHIYDLSGDERYEELWRLICPHCHVIALCYDATRKVTLIEAANMMLSVEHVLGPQPVITCGLIPDTNRRHNFKLEHSDMEWAEHAHKPEMPRSSISGGSSKAQGQLWHQDINGNCMNNKLTNKSAKSNSNNNNYNNSNNNDDNNHASKASSMTMVEKNINNKNESKVFNGLTQEDVCDNIKLEETALNNSLVDEREVNNIGKDAKVLLSTVSGQTQTPPLLSLGVHHYPASTPSTPIRVDKKYEPSNEFSVRLLKLRNVNNKVNNSNRENKNSCKSAVIKKKDSNSNNSIATTSAVTNAKLLGNAACEQEEASVTQGEEDLAMTMSEVYYKEELPIPLIIDPSSKEKGQQKKVVKESKEPSSLTLSSSSELPSKLSNVVEQVDEQNEMKQPHEGTNHKQDNFNRSTNITISGKDPYVVKETVNCLEVSVEDSAEITVRGAGSVQCPIHDGSLLFTNLLQCLVDQITAATLATTTTIADISEDVIGESIHLTNGQSACVSQRQNVASPSSSTFADEQTSPIPEHLVHKPHNEFHVSKINGSANGKQNVSSREGTDNKQSILQPNKSNVVYKQSDRRANNKRHKVRQSVLQELLNISTQPSPLDVLLDFK